MKKLYFISGTICAIILIYWLSSYIPSVFNKAYTVTVASINDSQDAYTGSFAFKSTPERSDLLLPMLNIANEFIKNPPKTLEENKEISIKNFYKLEKFFPTFNSYYIAKTKITNAIFNELSVLYANTSSLPDNELKNYFNSNKDYLEKSFGINNFSDFSDITKISKKIYSSKIIKSELEESYFYLTESNILNFRIILTLEDQTNLYIGIAANIFESNDYQTAPLIKIFDSSGGNIYE